MNFDNITKFSKCMTLTKFDNFDSYHHNLILLSKLSHFPNHQKTGRILAKNCKCLILQIMIFFKYFSIRWGRRSNYNGVHYDGIHNDFDRNNIYYNNHYNTPNDHHNNYYNYNNDNNNEGVNTTTDQ